MKGGGSLARFQSSNRFMEPPRGWSMGGFYLLRKISSAPTCGGVSPTTAALEE
jgi:hypothetical protein